MKQFFLAFNIALLFITTINRSEAQSGATIYTSGRYILGPCDDTLSLRGINYAPYNWGWETSKLYIDEIAKTGANCIRLVWYKSNVDAVPNTTYTTYKYLDSAISKCIQNKIVPIVDLHDQTCNNDTAALSLLTDWYLQPAILAIINKYKHSLIINVANEALYVNWTSNPTLSKSIFSSTYTNIVNKLRAGGVTVPLLIDGPDCGTNLDVLADVGATLQAADPMHNLMFSAHSYWYAYAGNDSLTMLNKVNYALSKNIPFIIGELSNYQDDPTPCQYLLNYKPMMNICKTKNIGWLTWGWDKDVCAARQVSTDGTFAHLTTFGDDVVNNVNYGLATNTPAKSKYLVAGKCSTASIQTIENKTKVLLLPNPTSDVFNIKSNEAIVSIKVYDLMGREITFTKLDYNQYSLNNTQEGNYIVEISTKNTILHEIISVKN
jgi:mannan endo-1,4-beta-mannosidase